MQPIKDFNGSFIEKYLNSKDARCPICQDYFQEKDFLVGKGETIAKIYRTSCDHFFHVSCLDKWDAPLRAQANNASSPTLCLICRQPGVFFHLDIKTWNKELAELRKERNAVLKKRTFDQEAAKADAAWRAKMQKLDVIKTAKDQYRKQFPEKFDKEEAIHVGMPPSRNSFLWCLVEVLCPVLERVEQVLVERGDMAHPLIDCSRNVYMIGTKRLEEAVIADLEKVRHLDFIIASPPDHAVVCQAIEILTQHAQSTTPAPIPRLMIGNKGKDRKREELEADFYHQQKIVHDVLNKGAWFFKANKDNAKCHECVKALDFARGGWKTNHKNDSCQALPSAHSLVPRLNPAWAACIAAGLVQRSDEEKEALQRFLRTLKALQQTQGS